MDEELHKQKEALVNLKLTNDKKRVILTKLFEKISLKDGFVSVKYTKLAQAIAFNSGQTREILGYAK